MIEWFFYSSWILWGAIATASLLNAVSYLWGSARMDASWASGREKEKQRQVSLVVAIKGFDPVNTPKFFEAMRSQDYRRYRVIFAMESPGDPVAPWLRDQLGLAPDETVWTPEAAGGLQEIQLVYSGPCEGRGQKVHNQLAAFECLNEEDRIVAFADADMQADPDWLSRLVAPINAGTHQVSTTYRYFIPAQPSFVNAIATAINGSVATLGGTEKWNNLWGGSMAIAREDFDDINVPELFSGSLNDDLRLGRASRRSGRKVAFVRSLLRPSPVDFTWGSFFEFGRRQYVQVKFFAPIFYRISYLLTWGYTIGFLTAVYAAVAWGSVAAMSVLGGVFACDVARGLARRRVLKNLFGPEIIRALRGLLWVELFLTPFWMAVHAGLTTSALFTNRIRWAGIHYHLHSIEKTEVLGRDAIPSSETPEEGAGLIGRG